MKKTFILLLICGISQMLNAQIPSYIPKDSLVGYWPFNGNANDESGNGNHGSLIGGASLSFDRLGTLNSSYTFDGINCGGPKGISLPSNVSNVGEYTVTCWFQSIDSNKLDQSIFNTFPHQYIGVGLQVNSSFLNKHLAWAGNGAWQISGSTNNWNIYKLHDWHTLTIVKKTTELKYYQDGILVRTQSINSNFNVGSFTNIFVGALSINGGSQCYQTFKGRIDDIGIWSRALDSNEIKSIFNSCPKKITSEPQSVTTNNRFATFSCTANDTFQSFQWQKLKNGTWTNIKDSGQYSGCKTNKLFVNHILKVNNNEQFRCQIKGNCINTFTQAASLNFNCKTEQTNKPKNYGLFEGNAIFVSNNNDTLVNYQWQTNQGTGWNNLFNAGQYSGVNNDMLIVENVSTSNSGQLFRCIMQGDCGKDTSIEAKLSVWGVNTNSINKQAFILSPNPVKDILNIQGVQTNANYQITNAIGQTCLQGKFTEKLDVSALKSGVYFFKTETGTQRFVKE
jgi:hypothetical protein